MNGFIEIFIQMIGNTPTPIAWALGFFMALSLRQGRLDVVLDRLFPDMKEEDSCDE